MYKSIQNWVLPSMLQTSGVFLRFVSCNDCSFNFVLCCSKFCSCEVELKPLYATECFLAQLRSSDLESKIV